MTLLIQALVDKDTSHHTFIIPRADCVLLVVEGKQYEIKMSKEQMFHKAMEFIKAALEKKE
jgi:hypothetical protein